MAQDPFDKYRVKEDEEDDPFTKYAIEEEPIVEEEEEPSILKRAYTALSEPLTNLPSRIADTVAEPMMAYGESKNGILNKGALYGGAFLSSLGDVVDSMTSPIDLAATALTGGASAAGKKGALALAGKLNTAGRLTSVLPVAHGVSEIADGNILGGGLEAGLGALGMRGQKFNPKVAQNLDELGPPVKEPIVASPVLPETPNNTLIFETSLAPKSEVLIPELVDDFAAPSPRQELISKGVEVPDWANRNDKGLVWIENGGPGKKGHYTTETNATLIDDRLKMREKKRLWDNNPELTGHQQAAQNNWNRKLGKLDGEFEPELPQSRIDELVAQNEVSAQDWITNFSNRNAISNLSLPETVKSRPVLSLDYSPSSEQRAHDVLKRAGVIELNGMSNKQIIELAEQSKPGHQKPKIKVKLDPTTNSLIPDTDDPLTVSVLKSAQTRKPVPQGERISPNTEIEMPIPETAEYTGKNLHILAMQQSVPGGIPETIHDVTKTQEWLGLPRAIQSAYDLSFPLRQGIGLVHTKGWWKAWPDMIKSAGDEGAYRAVIDSIAERPNFRGVIDQSGKVQKSFAQQAGLAVTDLGSLASREEELGSKLAEKIPGIRASNRAYNAFANKLRADTFDSLIADAERAGLNPKQDMTLAKSIAEYVNTASGRGSLGSLESSAVALNNLLFSPRLIASRVKMLNPATYAMGNPFVRKQYWKSMASIVGAYSTFTALNNMAGGTTGTDDPTSSDFGRTKIGNTRFDPSGGLLPYITLFSRMGKGTLDMVQGKEDGRYSGKFGSNTGVSDVGEFFGNKASPILGQGLKFYGVNKNRPYEASDQALRMFTPIMLQDLSELLKEDPSLAPFGMAQSMIGIGSNTYEKGKPPDRLLPESIDPFLRKDFTIPRSFRR